MPGQKVLVLLGYSPCEIFDIVLPLSDCFTSVFAVKINLLALFLVVFPCHTRKQIAPEDQYLGSTQAWTLHWGHSSDLSARLETGNKNRSSSFFSKCFYYLRVLQQFLFHLPVWTIHLQKLSRVNSQTRLIYPKPKARSFNLMLRRDTTS